MELSPEADYDDVHCRFIVADENSSNPPGLELPNALEDVLFAVFGFPTDVYRTKNKEKVVQMVLTSSSFADRNFASAFLLFGRKY